MCGIIGIKRIFLTALLLAALLPQDGWACVVIGTQPEKIQEAVDNAVFIGKVRLISVNENPSLTLRQKWFYKRKWGTPVEIRLMPVQSYKEPYQEIIIAYAASDSCRKPYAKEGEIYEEIIFQKQDRDNMFFVSSLPSLLPDETWKDLRDKAQPNPQIEEIKSKCTASGRKWEMRKERYINIFDCSSGG